MFIKYNIVDESTGMIVSQLGADLEIAPDAVSINLQPGFVAYEGEDADTPDEFYYVDDVKTERPEFTSVGSWNKLAIMANGVDDATFTGLPNPTTIGITVPAGLGLDIPGDIIETSGSFSLVTSVPGTYYVVFESFPYKQGQYTVEAS